MPRCCNICEEDIERVGLVGAETGHNIHKVAVVAELNFRIDNILDYDVRRFRGTFRVVSIFLEHFSKKSTEWQFDRHRSQIGSGFTCCLDMKFSSFILSR